MGEHRFTPVPFVPYKLEAMRAMDWAVESAVGAGAVKAAVVYQQDDYGQDGLEGWRSAAEFHSVEIVSELAVAPGQSDFTAIVSTLRSNDANYVLVTALPSSVSPLLGTAAQLDYAPTWIEIATLVGSFGLFFTCFLLFCRFSLCMYVCMSVNNIA